jgi:hypothetical protein
MWVGLVGCTLPIYTHGWLTLAVRVKVRLRTKEGEGGVDRGISE